MLDENWKVLANRFKKVDTFRRKILAQKWKRLKKTGIFYYLFLSYFTLFQNTVVNSEAFRWNIPPRINLFFSEEYVPAQKVEMV